MEHEGAVITARQCHAGRACRRVDHEPAIPPAKTERIRVAIAAPDHRFPPPWSVEEQEACFVVRDRGGQQLAYVY
jgi:hypothetical protein